MLTVLVEVKGLAMYVCGGVSSSLCFSFVLFFCVVLVFVCLLLL